MQNDQTGQRIDFFIGKCREHNLKITPQRVAIFEALAASRDHPSADRIYRTVKKQFPNVSFDTVNRALLTFAEIGIVEVVEGRGIPRRYDSDTKSHHHFHCTQCGQIIDFHNEDYDRLYVPAELRQLHTINKKRVVLYGVCNQCQRQPDVFGEKGIQNQNKEEER